MTIMQKINEDIMSVVEYMANHGLGNIETPGPDGVRFVLSLAVVPTEEQGAQE